MIDLKSLEIWFITGSQHLYGEETLKQVAAHSQEIAAFLNSAKEISVSIVYKPTVKTPEEIAAVCKEANASQTCIGIITWMHTFSPAKMWINGLKILQKPLLHLHTQFNRDIPWNDIDMDFMNLNQSAHGDREFGFIVSRLRMERKVVVGYWKEEATLKSIDIWCRAAAGWNDWQGAKFVRFGDNMRYVAVTDGDKVEAEYTFGFSVNTHGIGDLVKVIDAIKDADVDKLVEEYEDSYTLSDALQKNGTQRASLKDAARIELGLKTFLEDGNFKGFTDTFEDLYGMKQLPGIAAQRLMEAGYGFAGEGDWKTAALVLYTSQRLSDVLIMRWSDINEGLIAVVQGKTTKKLWIPLHKQLKILLSTLEARLRERRGDAGRDLDLRYCHESILLNMWGKPWTPDGFKARHGPSSSTSPSWPNSADDNSCFTGCASRRRAGGQERQRRQTDRVCTTSLRICTTGRERSDASY